MTFKQVLKIAEEHNIQAFRLLVATEVKDYLDINEVNVSEDEFETICEFVYDWVLNTEAQPLEVVDNLVKAIQEDENITFSTIADYWSELTDTINRMF